MIRKYIIAAIAVICIVSTYSFKDEETTVYEQLYRKNLNACSNGQKQLLELVASIPALDSNSIASINQQIAKNRTQLKKIDFWLRYFEPNAYKKINGPLPVEWETEVFEKFEKPYKRVGAGLTVTEIYLGGENPDKKIVLDYLRSAEAAIAVYESEPIVKNLKSADIFYLCNRLYILNLSTIYSTGFECPNTKNIIPEMLQMMVDVNEIYAAYNQSFPDKKIQSDYQELYDQTIDFVKSQPKDYTKFDHFTFIKEYVNPLFAMNQKAIVNYHVVSKSTLDYTLNDHANSIFDKSVFFAQNQNGIYYRIKDTLVLKEIDSIGKLLFYDPILSGNNLRSCVSCHKSDDYFTNTTTKTALQFNQTDVLARNTPSLLNAPYNHLIMIDGKLLSLQEQAKTVVTNPLEMGSNEAELLQKVMSCATYKKAFKKFAKYTQVENKVSLSHIYSALTTYYSKYSQHYAPFDHAMNKKQTLKEDEIKGFNLFMSKAQCATCHFPPTFSGIKPPYIGNEFEVIGVPSDTTFAALDSDKGRYDVNPAEETLNAFRTTTIRNSEKTKPYMHNGVFNTLEEVVNFYNRGGGAGHKIAVPNQTATADSLHLSLVEKKQLISFIKTLNENIPFEKPPLGLPKSRIKNLNTRTVGGKY